MQLSKRQRCRNVAKLLKKILMNPKMNLKEKNIKVPWYGQGISTNDFIFIVEKWSSRLIILLNKLSFEINKKKRNVDIIIRL